MTRTKNASAGASVPHKAPDPVALTQALIDVYRRAQPVFEEFFARQQGRDWTNENFDPLNVSHAWIEFAQKLLSDPKKFWDAQADYWGRWMHLWQESTRKFLGEDGKTVIEPQKSDRRFKAPEWQESALFDFIKQSYLLTCEWTEKTVRGAEGLSPADKEKLAFSARLFTDAMSPSNFLLTNPEVLNETLESGGENLIRGLENLIEDLERGKGQLKISTTDYNAFRLGENIAVTPGRVIYQNDLMQLIQYEPTTDKVFKRPLLVIPPWINKYYILDLRPGNSYIKWAVDQGHTVFTVSWVNPTPALAQKTFADYLENGVFDALAQIESATGAPDCNVVGYCLGGTLLAMGMAVLAARSEAEKIASATFLTTLLDFENSGDMRLFLDPGQIEALGRAMAEKGMLEARQLQQTFSLLRANDLIWSFVVNNYLMGREPFPFDLLYWNDDSTNMPAAMHSYYLCNMYRDNMLTKPGALKMDGIPVDLSKVKTPAYFLSTREDHIAPWKATYAGINLLGGPAIFTLAASGHIAGVVNAPAKNKYCYWSAEKIPDDPEVWMKSAQEHTGSWWPHWQAWMENYTGGKIAPRKPATGLEPAPGSYVKVKS